MNNYFLIFLVLIAFGCTSNRNKPAKSIKTAMTQLNIKNDQFKSYTFLKNMYEDPYFPNFLVDKGKAILVELCLKIEAQNPKKLQELYSLTHAATSRFNDLDDEFAENESEIETAARECIAEDFDFIAKSFGFEADVEELIATREW